MEKVYINSDYITLGQFVKFCNLVNSGSESKLFILNNKISVNGVNEKRRGRKLKVNDTVLINGVSYYICSSNK